VENIERVLAGLIILALLALLILIAIPVNRPEPGNVPRAGNQEADRRTPERPVRQPAPTPEPARPPEPDSREVRLDNRNDRAVEGRSGVEQRDRRARTTCGDDCDCCCGTARRYRTAERRAARRQPTERYVESDEPYWAERRRRPERSRPYWAQIPPGVCAD
jgi:hypothetical protein